MHKWEQFEAEILDAYGVGAHLTNRYIAEDWGIEPREASALIQSYLGAQRRGSKTRYMLVREGRTSRAIWTLGARSKDARQVIGQFGRDVKCRMLRAVAPDLQRVATINPRARSVIEEQLEPLLDGVASVIQAMISTVGWNGDE